MKEATANSARHPPNYYGMAFLVFILVAGPLAWSLDLLVKFVLASNACLSPHHSLRWLFEPSTFIVIDVLAFAVTAVAAWAAYRSWNSPIPARTGHFHAATDIGEGRQHFLALWGMWIGAMFLSAIAFSFVVNLAVQPCIS
jgi:hypothetical protein